MLVGSVLRFQSAHGGPVLPITVNDRTSNWALLTEVLRWLVSSVFVASSSARSFVTTSCSADNSDSASDSRSFSAIRACSNSAIGTGMFVVEDFPQHGSVFLQPLFVSPFILALFELKFGFFKRLPELNEIR